VDEATSPFREPNQAARATSDYTQLIRADTLLLLIDNYDSFVHNLARYFRELGCETRVVRNDARSVEELVAMEPDAVVLSPGPCTPAEAGVCEELVRRCAGSISLLGVCLGHQAIWSALGGNVIRARQPVHGQTSLVHHDGSAMFGEVPDSFRVMRYHSLVIDELNVPVGLAVTARTEDGVPMAVADARRRLYGLQFHPESILTEHGHRLLSNFLTLAGLEPRRVPVVELQCEVDCGLWQQVPEPTAVRPQ